ncbi:MAG TPA: universal stress protein [bacterium]|nr:universal stress protein [bacterium]
MAQLKILWGVNPFQDGSEIRRKGELFLKSLGGKPRTVTPVYVSSPMELQIALEFSVPLQERYRQVAEQSLKKYLSKVKGLPLRPARVIIESSPGLAAASKALAVHAAREKADAVAVGTHARSGWTRFVLGSYAESLLAFSRTPLVFLNPRARVAGKIRKILFATDLSPASRKAFAFLCRFAAATGASVEVLHAVETPRHWATTYGLLLAGSRALTIDEYLADLRETGLRKIGAFLKIAKSAGVKALPRVEVAPRRVSDIVLKAADSDHVDMIALAAQSSRLRAGLLGSVARDVLRWSRVPVWIWNAVR